MSLLTGGLDAMAPSNQCTQFDALPWFVRSGRRDNSYWRRGDSQFGSRNKYVTLWPGSGFMSGDRSEGFCMLGQDCCEQDQWGPIQRASRGNGAQKFIMGSCKDSGGSPVSGATVQCFLTANDNLVSEVTSNTNGTYEAPTVYPGAAHYLVAYRPGSPAIAGTTVNTLTGTNRDGT